jgi:hypothetical protein
MKCVIQINDDVTKTQIVEAIVDRYFYEVIIPELFSLELNIK